MYICGSIKSWHHQLQLGTVSAVTVQLINVMHWCPVLHGHKEGTNFHLSTTSKCIIKWWQDVVSSCDLAGIWQSNPNWCTCVGSYDIHAYIQVTSLLARETKHTSWYDLKCDNLNISHTSERVPLYTHVRNDLIITSSYNMYVAWPEYTFLLVSGGANACSIAYFDLAGCSQAIIFGGDGVRVGGEGDEPINVGRRGYVVSCPDLSGKIVCKLPIPFWSQYFEIAVTSHQQDMNSKTL